MTVQPELFPYVAVQSPCRRCGRALRNVKTIVAGIGPVCGRKESMELASPPRPARERPEVGVAGPLPPPSLLPSPTEGKVGVNGESGAKQGVSRPPVGDASPHVFSLENNGLSPTTPTFLAFPSEKGTPTEALCGEGGQSRGDCFTPTFSSPMSAAAVEGGVR